MPALIHWLRQSPFNIVAALQSKKQRGSLNARVATPFRQRQRLAVVCVSDVLLRIAGLLRRCSPSHVTGFIMAVIVDTVQRMRWRRLRPHVGKERLELVAPCFAYSDAASTVSRKVLIFGIKAAGAHRVPLRIFRRTTHPVRAVHIASPFTGQATTGSCVSVSQMCAIHGAEPTTIAGAVPFNTTGYLIGQMDNRQSTKLLTNHYFSCSHFTPVREYASR